MKMEQMNGANLLAMRSLAQQAKDSAVTTLGNMDALVQHYVALQTENVKLRAQCQYMTEGMRDVFPQAHRLALELECLLLSCTDTAATAKWWDSAHEALEQWREFCREDSTHNVQIEPPSRLLAKVGSNAGLGLGRKGESDAN